MTSSAPKRRLDVRQAPRATGKRAAVQPRRRRRTMRPSPAMAGAFVLVVAGIGAGAVSTQTDTDSLAAGYQTISASYAGEGTEVDITEPIDDEVLAAQTEAQAQQTLQAQAGLTQRAQEAADELQSTQWVLPVTGYRLTARFGQSSSLWSSTHTGVDFAGPSGSTIVAVAGGTVSSTGYEGAYGNKTVITLEDGTEIWYAHQSRIAVSPGEQVAPGQVIGYTGSTGNVTGPHLHLEVRPGGGNPIDPLVALAEHGVTP